MQTTRALISCGALAPLRRTQLDRGAVLGLASSGLSRGSEVYVLADHALDLLASSLPDGAMLDRGWKDPRKALAGYFGRRTGLLRIRAAYRQVGQAERGIRALLGAVAGRLPTTRCFIGIPEPVFEAMWSRSPEAGRTGAGLRTRPPADGAREDVLELLALHPELEIPEVVQRSYLGSAPVVRLVHYLVVLAAKCNFPVLIAGESGTGKEVVARLIHTLQFGRDGKCVMVNCGGIPGDLLESELFGHVKGAFTGATRNKTGLWQDAQNGTIFLDEVGDLSPFHQAKVLRAIEDRTLRAVGGLRPFKSNARVLCATHRDLEAMVGSRRFREDLYHRLVVLRIRTPALREHPEDIPPIARHLWESIRLQRSQTLPDDVMSLLQAQPLPGNVRELRSALAAIAMLSNGKPITARLARLALRERGSIEDL